MNEKQAVTRLSALAHLHRLHIFRLLVQNGSTGVAAGTISEKLDIGATSTSFHLKELERAGLITGTREGRYILYSLQAESMRELLAFLTEDCCEGKPELCGVEIDNRAGCVAKLPNSE